MSFDCRHRLQIEGRRYCASVAMALPSRRLGDLQLCAICPQRDKPGADVPLPALYEIARVRLGEPARPPPLIKQIGTYLRAMARWALEGYPERPPERVAGILEICRGCPQFEATDDGLHRCRYCGCGGAASKWTGGLREKITMATEACPLRKW
jgi:hypothetical protein